ncbi:hypothetical protein ACFWFU_23920 [Streptomyces sp. NPDC060235]
MDTGDDMTFEEWCAEMEAVDQEEYEQVMAELDASAAGQTS